MQAHWEYRAADRREYVDRGRLDREGRAADRRECVDRGRLDREGRAADRRECVDRGRLDREGRAADRRGSVDHGGLHGPDDRAVHCDHVGLAASAYGVLDQTNARAALAALAARALEGTVYHHREGARAASAKGAVAASSAHANAVWASGLLEVARGWALEQALGSRPAWAAAAQGQQGLALVLAALPRCLQDNCRQQLLSPTQSFESNNTCASPFCFLHIPHRSDCVLAASGSCNARWNPSTAAMPWRALPFQLRCSHSSPACVENLDPRCGCKGYSPRAGARRSCPAPSPPTTGEQPSINGNRRARASCSVHTLCHRDTYIPPVGVVWSTCTITARYRMAYLPEASVALQVAMRC